MKLFKHIFCVIATLILISSSIMPMTIYAESANEASLGYRTISYQISSSDLDNYADGGRSGLDISLRSNLPQGVSYSFVTAERQVTLTLHFEFDSAQDYRKKVIGLCGIDTSVICSFDDNLLLVENATAMNYLDFIFETDKTVNAGASGPSSAVDIRSMMMVTKNVLYVNGTEYQIDNSINFRPESSVENVVKADYLSLYTEGRINGKFKRTVLVEINDDENGNKKDYFRKRFSKVGKVKTEQKSNEEISLKVTFEAYGQEELARITEKCLGCKVLQNEILYPIDDKTVGAVNQEYYDLNDILNDDGVFSYIFDAPSYYKNIETVDGYSYLVESDIGAESEIITYTYQRKFCFDEIFVSTDTSGLFGKINRTIRLCVASEIADYYHESIKAQLSARLPKNSVMNIAKDQNGVYYEICFSSFSDKKVSEFTNSILDYSGNLTVERGFWGISNQISENISFDNILKDVSPARRSLASYKLIFTASLKKEMKEYKEEYDFNDDAVLWTVCVTEDINIIYNGVNIIKVIPFVVVLLALGGATFVIVKKKLLTRMRDKASKTNDEEISNQNTVV